MNGVMKLLDEKDIQTLGQLLDSKIEASENRMTTFFKSEIGRSIQESEARMTTLFRTEMAKSVGEAEARMVAYSEAAIEPKFDLLADGHKLLQETLAPKSRVEALEDEVAFMKRVIHSLSQDVEALKKAQ